MNNHGVKEEEQIKIPGFITYKVNTFNEINDGSAILIKQNIKHKLDDNYLTDVLEIIINTDIGEVGIATTYLPPRRPYLPFPDFNSLATIHRPTYIIGDLNASHTLLGNRSNNQVVKNLERLLSIGKLQHIGPDFSTFKGRLSQTTPRYNTVEQQSSTQYNNQTRTSDRIRSHPYNINLDHENSNKDSTSNTHFKGRQLGKIKR